MIPNANECCFCKIKENTKNEYVTVGSDGNILRWKNTNDNKQSWLIVPISETKCKIMTKQNGEELMAVGSNGNILCWEDNDGKEQHFSFLNPRKSDEGTWWNIQESTKNEYVAVGSDGNILRWGKTGKKDQEFMLVPDEPKNKPSVKEGPYAPGAIPDIPRIQGFTNLPPETSDYYLIGETIVTAVTVYDNIFSDKIEQVEFNPYYILTREQYWSRSAGQGFYFEHDGQTEVKKEYKIQNGFSETQSKSFEKTLSIVITAEGGFEYMGGTASVSTEISKALKVAESSESKRMTSLEEGVTWTYPRGRRFAQAYWTLIDRYTLKRMDDTTVHSWEISNGRTVVTDSYPEL